MKTHQGHVGWYVANSGEDMAHWAITDRDLPFRTLACSGLVVVTSRKHQVWRIRDSVKI